MAHNDVHFFRLQSGKVELESMGILEMKDLKAFLTHQG